MSVWLVVIAAGLAGGLFCWFLLKSEQPVEKGAVRATKKKARRK